LNWLYERLQPHRYKQRFQYDAIRWSCAESPGKLFKQLVEADFANCSAGMASSTASACEDLIPTTTPAVIYPADPRLELTVTARTQNSVTVEWTLRDIDLDVVSQLVTRRQLGSDEKAQVHLSASQRRQVLTGLQPNTTYKVCVELAAGNRTSDEVEETVVSCCLATTSFPGGPSSSWASNELLVAISLGGGLAAVVLVSVAVCCCCAVRRRRRHQPPQPSVQTKRYRKTTPYGTAAMTSPPSGERTSNPYNSDVDRAIVESVERLDPESKEVLANLLRSASAASLDHIGGPSPPSAGAYQAAAGSRGRPRSSDGQNFYDDLTDDMYDQIPTDEFV